MPTCKLCFHCTHMNFYKNMKWKEMQQYTREQADDFLYNDCGNLIKYVNT